MRWPKVALIAAGAVLAAGFSYGSVSSALASQQGLVPGSAGPTGPASLTVTITSLPPSAVAEVTVTGPDFFFRVAPRSETLRGLRPGTYVVHAYPVRVRSGELYPVTPEVRVRLQPGSNSVVQISYADEVPSTTKVPAASTVTGLSGSPAGPATLTLSSLPGGALSVGDVLAIGVTAVTPDGFLGKVTAFSHSGTGYTVSTVPATLEEAMPNGVIDPSWTEPAQNEPVDESSLSCGTGASLSVTGNLNLTPGGDFAAQWVNGVVTSASFDGSLTVTQQLKAVVNGAASCKVDNQPLLANPIEFGRIPVDIGIPIVLTPELQFNLSADATTNASLTENATMTATATAALDYGNGQLTPVSKFTTSFTPQAPAPALQASLSAQCPCFRDIRPGQAQVLRYRA